MKENNKMKVCKWCNKEKMMDEFYSQNKKKKDGTEYTYYHPECKQCTKDNSEKWRKDPKNRETYKRICRKKNIKFKSLLRENGKRQRENGYNKQYYYKNKEKFKEYRFKRQHTDHDITEMEWDECRKYFDYSCAYCGISEETAKIEQGQYLHKEHFNHDGKNDLSNCVPACKSCNSRKWTFNFYEWYSLEDSYAKHFYSINKIKKIEKWLDGDYKGCIQN